MPPTPPAKLGSFDALMALASKQTEASQHALAKENQLRQAREKAKRLEEERKEKERLRLEKERLAKQKLEDQKREQQLHEERQRRQAERAAAAEMSRKQDEANRPSSSKSANTPRSRPVGRTASSTPIVSSKDAEEQRRLEREEKQARARARLFGEPVSAHKKSTTSRSATNSQRNASFGKGKGPLKPFSLPGAPKTASSSSAPVTARQRIEQQFSVGERKPLNQGKRDRRTIEEIEHDMKQRKGLTDGAPPTASRPTNHTFFESRSVPKKTIVPLRPIASGSALSGPPSARAVSGTGIKRKAMSPPSSTHPMKRNLPGKPLSRTNGAASSLQATSSGSTSRLKNVASHSEEDDEEDEYEEDSAVEVEAVSPAIRDEIWKIMGKDRNKYAAKTILSDDESDDMEADVDDVLEEEGRAARLARLEDQREQEALRRHELEKKKRLSQSRIK